MTTGFSRLARTILIILGLAVLAGCQPARGPVVQQVAGPDGGWDFATFDAPRQRILVGRSFGAMAMDIGNGRITSLAPGAHVHIVLALTDGRLLMTNGDSNSVTLADGRTGAILAAIPVGKEPDAALIDPVGGEALVINAGSGEVSVIDLARGREAARISVGGSLEFAVTDRQGLLFVNVEDTAEVAVIDIAGRQVKARFRLAGCEGPTGLAFVAPERLLIAACGNGHAKVIAADTGREVADIPIGPHPDAVLYDPVRRLAYIPTAGSLTRNGEITVLRIAGPSALSLWARIPTVRGARTIAEDPATGRLYLPTANYALGLDGQPHPVAGTFRILVVAP